VHSLENSLCNKQLQLYHNTDYGMNTGSITAPCCNDRRFSDLRCVQEMNSDEMSQSTKMECNFKHNGRTYLAHRETKVWNQNGI